MNKLLQYLMSQPNVEHRILPGLQKMQKAKQPCYECGGSVNKYDVGGFYDCPDQEKDPVTGKCKAEVVRGREAAAANKAANADMNAWAKQVAAMDKENAKQYAAQAAGQLTFDYDWMQSPLDKADKKAAMTSSKQFFQQNPNVFVADDTSGYSPEQKYIIASKLKQRLSTPMGSKLAQEKLGVDPRYYDLQRMQSELAPKMGGWNGMRNFLFNVYKEEGGEYDLPQAQWGTFVNPTTIAAMATMAAKAKEFFGFNEPKIVRTPASAPKRLSIRDPRKVMMTTGKPLRPNSDLVSGDYDSEDLGKLLTEAKRKNMSYNDMMNLAAMGFQETKWGKTDYNIGHTKGVHSDNPEEDTYQSFISAYNSKMKDADRLKIKDEATRLQVYNGLGKVFPSTEADYHGFKMKKIYGVEVPKGGIDLRKNPLYGKQVIDIRDNVLKRNPEFMRYMDSTYRAPMPKEEFANGGPILDPRGQWAHPGKVTRIPSSNITMQGVPYPVYGVGSNGQEQMMYPEQEYNFGGASYVDEYPMMQDGGSIPVIEDAGDFNEEGVWVPDHAAMAEQAKKLGARKVRTRSGSILFFDKNWNITSADDNPMMRNGGLLSKSVSCSNCGWSWKAVEGGINPLTCHKCGGMVKMQGGGSTKKSTPKYTEVNSEAADIFRSLIPLPDNASQMLAKVFFKDARMSNNSLSDDQKLILWNTIQNAKKRSGVKTGGGTEYQDYGNQGYGSSDDFNQWFNRGKMGPLDITRYSLTNPGYKLASTIGRGRYFQDPNNPDDVLYTDVYDWNPSEANFSGSNGYQLLRNFLRSGEDKNLNKDKNDKFRMNFKLSKKEIDEIKKRKEEEAKGIMGLGLFKNGGYTVTRSNDRKGKTHKVTGPDGTVKYFGDSKLGQHPKDPERKAAFYARHKKNLDGNPYFRAFARKTWQTGGPTPEVIMPRSLEELMSPNRRGVANFNVGYNNKSFSGNYGYSGPDNFKNGTHSLNFSVPSFMKTGNLDASAVYSPGRSYSANLTGMAPANFIKKGATMNFSGGYQKDINPMMKNTAAPSYNMSAGFRIPTKAGNFTINASYRK